MRLLGQATENKQSMGTNAVCQMAERRQSEKQFDKQLDKQCVEQAKDKLTILSHRR